jgi:hypothetical protein
VNQLDLAKKYLAIAGLVDGNPDRAKKEAYKLAAVAVASHISETGDTQTAIAAKLGITKGAVGQLLKWQREGCQTVTPWRDVDGSKDRSAARAHAKTVLRSPTERRQTFAAMTDAEKSAVAAELMADRKVAETVVAPGSPARRVVKEAAEEDFVREVRARRVEAQHNLLPKTLGQYFWSVVGKLTDWTTALLGIEKELAALPANRKSTVRDGLVRLRDECDRCINIVDGLPADGQPLGDVIDSTATTTRPKMVSAG